MKRPKMVTNIRRKLSSKPSLSEMFILFVYLIVLFYCNSTSAAGEKDLLFIDVVAESSDGSSGIRSVVRGGGRGHTSHDHRHSDFFGYGGLKSYVDVYHAKCNKTLYDSTMYKKAWDLTEKSKFMQGAATLNNFTKIERLNQSNEWRKQVCDGYPHVLLECSKHPSYTEPICQCLNTRWTKFIPAKVKLAEEVVDGDEIELEVNVCRVPVSSKCDPDHTHAYPIQCQGRLHCISKVCSSATITAAIVFNAELLLFLILVYVCSAILQFCDPFVVEGSKYYSD